MKELPVKETPDEKQDDPAVEAFKVYQKGGKDALRKLLEGKQDQPASEHNDPACS